jgi:hypothetical protein
LNKLKGALKAALKWSKTAAGIISIILCITSLVLLMIACSTWGNFTERTANNINSILSGIATNLLGIIVTVSFVQYFIDRQNEQEEHTQERNMIIKYNRVMVLFLKRYKRYYNCVTNPITQRNDVDVTSLNPNFQFQDMQDMYRQSLYLYDGFYEPSVVLFYRAEDELRNYMIRVLENIQFKYYEELYDIIVEFVELSQSIDVRGSLLDELLIKKLDEKLLKDVEEYIKDAEQHRWVERASKGQLDSNIMLPYVHFYWLLQKEAELLTRYEVCVSKLDKEKMEE